MRTIEEVERKIMTFLTEHRGIHFSPFDLVRGVCERFPEDASDPATIKMAALNLVNAQRILIDHAWMVGFQVEDGAP